MAPGLLDRYLGRTGYASQQRDERHHAGLPANLWEPADGPDGRDFGMRGSFDDQAHNASPQVWVSQHHGLLGLGALIGAAAVAVAAVRR